MEFRFTFSANGDIILSFQVYREKNQTSGLVLGEITYAEVAPQKWIVNANTQRSTGQGRQVSYDAVTSCFEKVLVLARAIKAASGELPILFPMIGAGLGGGNWNVISTIIDETIGDEFTKILYVLP